MDLTKLLQVIISLSWVVKTSDYGQFSRIYTGLPLRQASTLDAAVGSVLAAKFAVEYFKRGRLIDVAVKRGRLTGRIN